MNGTDSTVEVVDALADVDKGEWDALASDHAVFASYDWLRFVESYYPFDASYVLARDKASRLIGSMPLYLSHGEGSTLYHPLLACGRPAMGPRADEYEWLPALICGNAAGYSNELLVCADLDVAQRATVINTLVSAIDRHAAEVGARTQLYPFLTTAAAKELAQLLGTAGEAQLIDANAEIAISRDWRMLDDYLDCLSVKRRKSARRELRSVADMGLTFRQGSLSEWASRIGPLLADVQQRYGGSETAESETKYLESQAEYLEQSSVVQLAFDRDRLVGFSHSLKWGSELSCRSVGCDPAYRSGLYFVLGFYAGIERAIEFGCDTYGLGAGAYSGKVLRGARLAPLWAYLRPPRGLEKAWQASVPDWNRREFQRWTSAPNGVGALVQASWRRPEED
jgi:uncharacterized protein